MISPFSAHTRRPSKYLQVFRFSFERDGLRRIVTSAHSCSRMYLYMFLILDAATTFTEPFTASQTPLAVPQHMLISQRLCTFISRSLFFSKHSEDRHNCNAVDKFDVYLTVHHTIDFSKYQLSAQFF